jgi:hypothetical protein
MSWTTNLLVIANRTIDSDELLRMLCSRSVAGPIQVTLVAPAEEGREPTARRLARATRRLEAEDITVEAIVGHPDPHVALEGVWDPQRFDEVIVATLPAEQSRWLALDLPHRVERFTGVRVTHVVATMAAVASTWDVPA